MRSERDLVSDFRTYSRINRAIAAGCASCHHRLLRIAVSRAISASGDGKGLQPASMRRVWVAFGSRALSISAAYGLLRSTVVFGGFRLCGLWT